VNVCGAGYKAAVFSADESGCLHLEGALKKKNSHGEDSLTHSLTHCTTVPLYHCTTVPLYHCIIVSVSLPHSLTHSITRGTTVYLSHSLTHSLTAHHYVIYCYGAAPLRSLSHSLTHLRAHSLTQVCGRSVSSTSTTSS
jgi:hypothetical protein